MVWLVCFWLSGFSPSVPAASMVSGSVAHLSPDTLEFTLSDHNHMILTGVLNGRDSLPLMFHTAISGVSVNTEFLDRQAVEGFDQADTLRSWGGEKLSRYAENQELALGNQTISDLTIYESGHSGQYTEGKFGPNVLFFQVLEIDPQAERLILHDRMPGLDSSWTSVKIRKDRGLIFVPLTLEVEGLQIEHEFLLHSGYEGTMLLDDAFVGAHPGIAQLPSFKESELKDSFGNIIKTRKVHISSVEVGGTSLTGFPLGFFEGALGRQRISVLGADVIQRFHWLIDLENDQVWIRANERVSLPFSEV
ncbi:MAG: hypothetical protein AAF399_21135 [Bacteroidota bacterium]